MEHTPVISYGEIVWDQFPDKKVLGGAPLNVAYHLYAQKWPAGMISRIGNDSYGAEALERIECLGIPLDGIQKDAELPTGLVLVSFAANNEPSYEIVQPSAWDNIRESEVPETITHAPFHLVFGTLAQRNGVSRRTLQLLLSRAQQKFYDVNLRPPFDLPELVESSLHAADVVKMTREELGQLNDWFLQSQETEDAVARTLIRMFGIAVIAVTDGDKGASIYDSERAFHHPGFPVAQADPVGSGDAFFSALIIGYLTGVPLQECLIRANRLGAFVASQSGATPEYPKDPRQLGLMGID